jgi:hypothetical protein
MAASARRSMVSLLPLTIGNRIVPPAARIRKG